MLSYSNLVLGEPAISTLDKRTTGKEKDNKNIHNDLCVIGYLRPDYYELLSREGLLSEGRTLFFITMQSRANQCIHIMKI